MDVVLGDAGRAALKAGLAALLVVAIGISQQNNLNGAKAVGIAGIVAVGAAVVSAIQVFVPQLSVRAYLPTAWGAAADAFIHAALAAFFTAVLGILAEPNYSAWHSLIIAAIVGAINAGLRAVQGAFTVGEAPARSSGLRQSRASTNTGGVVAVPPPAA